MCNFFSAEEAALVVPGLSVGAQPKRSERTQARDSL
jgi:hypothetical protein